MKSIVAFQLAALLVVSGAAAQYPEVTIRQIQEVPADSLHLLDSLGCTRWTLQTSPYYLDTVVVTGMCVVPPRELTYTSSGFNFLLADTASLAEWGGVFVRPYFGSGSPDTILAIQWGMLNIQPGDIVRFVGIVDEFPPFDCASATWIVPLFTYPLQIVGHRSLSPPVPVRVSDFYQGLFPGGRIRFANGEKYEGMRVVIKNIVITSYVSFASCTFAFVDSLGNMMSDFDASRWYTCRSHRDSSSTFSLPPIGAHIDSIVGYILPSGGSEAPRGFRIAPVRENALVWNDVKGSATTPIAHALHQNYPNPFNPTTNIEFRIANREFVSLKVFDVLGREVATLVEEVKEAGEHSVQFHANGLAGGVYFYQLSTINFVQTMKLLLLR